MVNKFFITGRPGIGKTTCLLRIVDMLKKENIELAGFTTTEVREEGRRIGFLLRDIKGRVSVWLARIGIRSRYRIGKYSVLVDEFEEFLSNNVLPEVEKARVIVIDEIGPMELLSKTFREFIAYVIPSPKPLVATLHIRARRNAFIDRLMRSIKYEIYTLTFENRNRVPTVVFGRLRELLRTESFQ